MNRYVYVSMFVMIALIISGCTSQQSPIPSLVGSTAPEFTLENTSGGQISLSDYDGEPVLLFFHMAVG
jgi:cytochrome oxidase Cu insertion factor (SCO1/SenC/PrrC family)